MTESQNQIIYNADAYVRLSKEDGDKELSDSILNQKEFISEFVKKHPEIRLHKFRVDDGYSGVNFIRPSFQEMMEDVKNGAVQCIIVKDLSRFGRNYIEVGRYIEKIFPFLHIRFIAINDNYDSLTGNRQSDHIMIPFRNLINDAYCRDISIKVRSQLEIKRNKGEFIGAFAPFGYVKSDLNKYELIIDEFAADIVRSIFKYYIQGYSAYKIADILNRFGLATPMDYKKDTGSRFYTGFKIHAKSKWNHVMVLRILQNEVYIGSVIQGKYSSPNHKIHSQVLQPKSLWTKISKMHQPIVSEHEFQMVQRLLKHDTKTSPKNQHLFPLAGLLKCADCKSNMIKKTVQAGDKKYHYYVCGGHKYHKNCTSHCISLITLETCVLKMINTHLIQIIEWENVDKALEKQSKHNQAGIKREEMISEKKREIEKYNHLRLSLYGDYKEALIEREEYEELKAFYSIRSQKANLELEHMKAAGSDVLMRSDGLKWADVLKKRGIVSHLSRELAVSLIDEIRIYDKTRIEIKFCYQNEFKQKTDKVGV